VNKENPDSDLYGGEQTFDILVYAGRIPIYTDLYDDEFTVPLDDEYQSPVEETNASTFDKLSEPTSATTTPATDFKSESSGTGSLPAKPAVTESPGLLSYSAQVAKQFSAYQQTPSQERQQRSAFP
ncbi:hypothetical protein BS17DRAFT_654703, partial [Gyrodon lividus]